MLQFVIRIHRFFIARNMNTFKQIRNPITGRCEWEPQHEDYDYHQEIARAAFADMLHDDERNKKYYKALQLAVNRMHAMGQPANVLDIGTGTGILSMMAVKCGADSVVACEAFRPMADCAEQIIESNGMKQSIKIVKKRSTDMIVAPDGDMTQRANILVTEVFDTELIGEGAISIFNHAHDELLQRDCIVIPDSAVIFAQVVECPFGWAWNKPRVLANLDGEVLLRTPKDITICRGSIALHDVQLNQLPKEQFKTIINPVEVYQFDWSGKTRNPFESSSSIKATAQTTGQMHLVFMWWHLRMDQTGEIILSCAPYWAHPDFEKFRQEKANEIPSQIIMPWRDHWMQAVYYLPTETMVQANEELYLKFNHDEYSMWFDVLRPDRMLTDVPQAICDCGFHIAYPRTRIGQLNDSLRNKKYLNYLENEINSNSVVLALSDGSLLALAAAATGCKRLYLLESNRYSFNIVQKYIEFNQLKNIELLENLDEFQNFNEITMIFGEPSFVSSILPWDNFYFGTLIAQLKDKLSEHCKIVPGHAVIYAVAVEFMDLHKIRSPLGKCEGFDMSLFDQLVSESSDLADSYVEAQPLWEYPCVALSEPIEILAVDFYNFLKPKTSTKDIPLKKSGSCNGIALWCDWKLTSNDSPKYTITSGPIDDIIVGQFIKWDIHTRQGVHLFPETKSVQPGDRMLCDLSFAPSVGRLCFKFDVKGV